MNISITSQCLTKKNNFYTQPHWTPCFSRRSKQSHTQLYMCRYNKSLIKKTAIFLSFYIFHLREWNGRFFRIIVRGRYIDKHKRLCVSTQGVLHQHGQFVVPVRNETLLAGQGGNDIAQSRKGLIDRHGFLFRKNVD